MPSVPLNQGSGNPNARPVVNAPEAASSGRRISQAPPSLSYWSLRCGATKRNGQRCTNWKMTGHDTCLGHLPKKGKDDSDRAA